MGLQASSTNCLYVFSLCEVSQRHPGPPKLISHIPLHCVVNVLNTWEERNLQIKQLFIAHGVCPAVGETKQEYLVLKYIVELVFSILSLLAQ